MAGDWTVLARRGPDTSVSRCPEGHIHVEYGVATLKLDDRRFLELAGAVCAAAHRLGWHPDACGRDVGGAAGGLSGMN